MYYTFEIPIITKLVFKPVKINNFEVVGCYDAYYEVELIASIVNVDSEDEYKSVINYRMYSKYYPYIESERCLNAETAMMRIKNIVTSKVQGAKTI